MHNLPAPFHLLPAHALECLDFKQPGHLFRQGENTHSLYFIESGLVVLSRFSAAGEEIIIHSAQTGETFAEAALFSGVYHCHAEVKQAARIWRIDKKAVLEQLQHDAAFALALTQRLAQQVQELRRQRELLAIRDAKERVFMALSENMPHASIKQLASQIGLSYEAVYRALAQLVRQGRIKKLGRGVYSVATKIC